MSKTGCWVLTKEVNAYDQEGEYFVAIWEKKPTLEQLAKHFGHTPEADYSGSVMKAVAFLMHVEKGGGRQGVEDEWFILKHVKYGDN